jgi:DNA-binding XRE family transcriptional regulator
MRLPLPYKTNNELTRFLVMEQARRATAAHGTSRPSIKDLEEELAQYCNVKQDTINLIRRHKNQPSLQVAMKIAEFLQVNVEEIFSITDNPDYKG